MGWNCVLSKAEIALRIQGIRRDAVSVRFPIHCRMHSLAANLGDQAFRRRQSTPYYSGEGESSEEAHDVSDGTRGNDRVLNVSCRKDEQPEPGGSEEEGFALPAVVFATPIQKLCHVLRQGAAVQESCSPWLARSLAD